MKQAALGRKLSPGQKRQKRVERLANPTLKKTGLTDLVVGAPEVTRGGSHCPRGRGSQTSSALRTSWRDTDPVAVRSWYTPVLTPPPKVGAI